MKSKATGYTAFYNGAADDDEETITPTTRPSVSKSNKKTALEAARKRVIKRRLQQAR